MLRKLSLEDVVYDSLHFPRAGLTGSERVCWGLNRLPHAPGSKDNAHKHTQKKCSPVGELVVCHTAANLEVRNPVSRHISKAGCCSVEDGG